MGDGEGMVEAAERPVSKAGYCPGCGGDAGHNWFDRSLCPEPCGSMHTRCRECGKALDHCSWEDEDAVLGHCIHGVDLDRAFCPDGCRV